MAGTERSSPETGRAGLEGSDEMIAAELAQGRTEALEELFLRYNKPLYNYLLRMVGHEDQAEDLVHETFVTLPKKVQTFEGRSKFRTWLYTVATNTARMHLRKLAVRRELPLNGSPDRPSPADDPPAAAEKRETIDRVRGAIDKLTETERESFLLYWYHKMSYDEIGQVLAINVNTAKVRVHRAHVRLSEILE